MKSLFLPAFLALTFSACSIFHHQNDTNRDVASILKTESDADLAKVFDGDAAQCGDHWSDAVSAKQQKVIGDVMANHGHRLYHALWHATRNSWDSLSQKERTEIKKLSPLWGENAPVCDGNKTADYSKSPAGEEFLLMHHKMVDHIRAALREKNLDCISGWKKLPNKNDQSKEGIAEYKLWPVPKGKKDDSYKSDEEGELLDAWAIYLHSKEFLKGKSLSYVGVVVENTIHNHMHMRWAAVPKPGDDFSSLDIKESEFSSKNLLKPSKYDAPSRRWLGNPYSAHVNPAFWKLHGFVDDTVALWLKANDKTKISEHCPKGDSKCYSWKSDWTGEDPKSKAMGGAHNHHTDVDGPGPDVDGDTLGKVLSHANFGNKAFENHLKSKAVQSAGHSDGSNDMNNPETFFTKYSPCSN